MRLWIFRALATALALLGEAGSVLRLAEIDRTAQIESAAFLQSSRDIGAGRIRPPLLAVSAVVIAEEATDIVAATLALVLVWLGASTTAALWLGLFLGLWPVGDFELELVGFPPPHPSWLAPLMVSLPLVCLMAFVSSFPTSLRRDDLARAGTIKNRLLNLSRFLHFGRFSFWLLDERRLIGSFFLVFVALAAAPPRMGAVGLVTLVVLSFVQISRLATARVRVAQPEERAAILWVASALTLLVTGFLAAVGLLLPPLFGGPLLLGAWTPAVGESIGQATSLAFLSLLVVAVLYKGAIDPALILHRTIFSGLGLVCAVFLYAALETVLADRMAAVLGLPGTFGSVIAAGLTALCLLPFRDPLKRAALRASSSVGKHTDGAQSEAF